MAEPVLVRDMGQALPIGHERFFFASIEAAPGTPQLQITVTGVIKLQSQGHLSWVFAKESTCLLLQVL